MAVLIPIAFLLLCMSRICWLTIIACVLRDTLEPSAKDIIVTLPHVSTMQLAPLTQEVMSACAQKDTR